MAVIIKDVDIPLGCCYEDYNGRTGYCPFCDTHDVPYCVLEPSHLVSKELLFIEVDSRPDWCPLIEIPEGAKVIKNRKIIKEIPDGLVPPWINRMVECEEEETIYEEEQND